MDDPNLDSSLARMETILQDLTLEEQIRYLTDMLKARKQSEIMQDIIRRRRTEMRRNKYRQDAAHRQHVLELKRNRCNWRYEHDEAYCEQVKAAARKRGVTAKETRDKGNRLHAILLELISS